MQLQNKERFQKKIKMKGGGLAELTQLKNKERVVVFNESECTGNIQTGTRKKFPAVGEVCMAIF